MGQEETPVFRMEVTARHYDWGWWLLAILFGFVIWKRL